MESADDMEPEDMKCRRLAALKDFATRNPTYQDAIKGQLRLEQRRATVRTEAGPWRLTRKGQGTPRGKQTARRKVVSYTKKGRWTNESSLELLNAVTRFEKSGSPAIGKEKWKAIAADLMQQPFILPEMVSLAESAQYCRIRFCNMVARRQAVGPPYGLPDELKEKLDEFSRLMLETRPVPSLLGKASRKSRCAAAVQKKSRMVRLARSQSNGKPTSECDVN